MIDFYNGKLSWNSSPISLRQQYYLKIYLDNSTSPFFLSVFMYSLKKRVVVSKTSQLYVKGWNCVIGILRSSGRRRLEKDCCPPLPCSVVPCVWTLCSVSLPVLLQLLFPYRPWCYTKNDYKLSLVVNTWPGLLPTKYQLTSKHVQQFIRC